MIAGSPISATIAPRLVDASARSRDCGSSSPIFCIASREAARGPRPCWIAVELRADQLDAVALEHAAPRRASIARFSAVWPPIVGSSASGRSRSMICSSDVDRHRLDVGAVRELRIGHDRRRVRVHEDDAVALLAQRLAAPACPSSRTRRPGRSRSAPSRSRGSSRMSVAPRHQASPLRDLRAGDPLAALRGARPSRGSAGRSSRRRAGPATPPGGTAPRRAAASRGASPSTVPSFRFTCVISTGSPAAAQRVGVDRVAVVLGADRDLAGREVLAGLVAAVVAELELVVSPPSARPRIWWPRQMPNIGLALGELAHVLADRPRTAAGSPGPFERNTPSGSSASTSLARSCRAGTTVTSKPCSTSRRRMLRLMPKS